jgi:hypothetical protein
MTITTAPVTTPIPTLTVDIAWNDFVTAITEAASDESTRLMTDVPTPQITAEPRTEEWNNQYQSQRQASRQRDELLNTFNIRLVVAVAQALDAAVPNFRTLEIEYRGSGDSGEACDISVSADASSVKPTEMSSWGHLIFSDEERKQVTAIHAEADAISADLLTEELTDWMDETCWSIAYNQNPGFECNEGGWGRISVERNADGEMKMSLDHTQMTATDEPTVVLN